MIRCLLWDFGDTLADERWMLTAPADAPDWVDVWSEIAGGELADAWNTGAIDGPRVYRAVATRLGISEKRVLDHVERCCHSISFFREVMDVAARSRLSQAIVTVNPDGFSQIIVPNYRLTERFAAIVTSWQEGTLDKGVMGHRALERLGGGITPSESLLIDNKEHNLRAWAAEGGRTYLFTTERQLIRDLSGPLAELAASCT